MNGTPLRAQKFSVNFAIKSKVSTLGKLSRLPVNKRFFQKICLILLIGCAQKASNAVPINQERIKAREGGYNTHNK